MGAAASERRWAQPPWTGDGRNSPVPLREEAGTDMARRGEKQWSPRRGHQRCSCAGEQRVVTRACRVSMGRAESSANTRPTGTEGKASRGLQEDFGLRAVTQRMAKGSTHAWSVGQGCLQHGVELRQEPVRGGTEGTQRGHGRLPTVGLGALSLKHSGIWRAGVSVGSCLSPAHSGRWPHDARVSPSQTLRPDTLQLPAAPHSTPRPPAPTGRQSEQLAAASQPLQLGC